MSCWIRSKWLLATRDGYNREITYEGNKKEKISLFLRSDFEGGSEAAIDLRKNRALFTDNIGVKYWMKCPEECKIDTLK